jgi:hypothetical protein
MFVSAGTTKGRMDAFATEATLRAMRVPKAMVLIINRPIGGGAKLVEATYGDVALGR